MDELLVVREQVICYYKRYETAVNFILKFMLGLLTFSIINGIGCYREEFEPLFSAPFNFPFLMLMTLLFTIFPPSLANLLVGLQIVLQISKSVEIAFFVFLLLILITVFYSRLSPKRSYLILALVLGFYFNLQYAVVLFAGLYCGLASIIPIAIGAFIWSFIPGFGELLSRSGAVVLEEMDIMGMLTGFLDTYKTIFEMVTGNFEWVFTAFVFAMMIVAVYAVSRLAMDYAKDIAVGIGAMAGVLGFIIGNMITAVSYSIIAVLLWMVLSVLIVEIIKFFDTVLDYSKSERVQFEDEENYYYVKMIPKMLVVNAKSADGRTHAKAAASIRKKSPPVPAPAERTRRPQPSPVPGAREIPVPEVSRRRLGDEVIPGQRRNLDDPIVYTREQSVSARPDEKLRARFMEEFDAPSFIRDKEPRDGR